MGFFELGLAVGFILGIIIAFSTLGDLPVLLTMILPFALAGLGAWLGTRADSANNRSTEAEIKKVEATEVDNLKGRYGLEEVFVNVDNGDFIGIGWDKKIIVSGVSSGRAIQHTFDSLAEVELEVESEEFSETESTTSTNRTSQIVGAATGGALFGPAGAVVGGLSAKQTTSGFSRTDRFDVRHVLRCRYLDRNEPLIETEFYNWHRGRKYWRKHVDRVSAVKRFHAHLSNILHENRKLQGDNT